MREKRSGAATSITTQGMLVTGGYNGDDRLSTTEYFDGEQWVAGPEMPVGMDSHCQVTVEETVIVTGNISYISNISIV